MTCAQPALIEAPWESDAPDATTVNVAVYVPAAYVCAASASTPWPDMGLEPSPKSRVQSVAPTNVAANTTTRGAGPAFGIAVNVMTLGSAGGTGVGVGAGVGVGLGVGVGFGVGVALGLGVGVLIGVGVGVRRAGVGFVVGGADGLAAGGGVTGGSVSGGLVAGGTVIGGSVSSIETGGRVGWPGAADWAVGEGLSVPAAATGPTLGDGRPLGWSTASGRA